MFFRPYIKISLARSICGNRSVVLLRSLNSGLITMSEEPPVKKFKTCDDLESSSKEEVDSKFANFKFNKKRVRMINEAETIGDEIEGVVYWMSRDQRVQDNWALIFAQKIALKYKVPLHVVFCLVPKFLDATIRHYDFLLNGLKEVEQDCVSLDISFHLLLGYAVEKLPLFIKDQNIGCVVTDFSPLRVPMKWVQDLSDTIPNVPLCQVDAHNVVPCWIASDKLEYSARTIRRKIHDKLGEFLTDFPPVIKHSYKSKISNQNVDWEAAESILEVDMKVKPVAWAKPGTKAGMMMLESFLSDRLKKFASDRNKPTHNVLSNLSPWFHFGQISAQRSILRVNEHKKTYKESAESFIEEALVRRELSDNFCFYQKNYDNFEGINDWARKTLNDHRKDKRAYLYSRDCLENSMTHDDLWNAAQIQLCKEGKMHGFLRMYWAKKILEWTPSPEEALAITIYLNDKYSLDGRDPSGFVGCMWSICGIHDQGFREREVFGKIRYMNYEGCRKKFDIHAFIARYGGKKYDYSPCT